MFAAENFGAEAVLPFFVKEIGAVKDVAISFF